MVSNSDEDLAVVLDYDHQNGSVKVQSYTPIDLKNPKTVTNSLSLAYLYVTACNYPESAIPMHSDFFSLDLSLILS